MSPATLTLQLDVEQNFALDQIATDLNCDRSELVKQAIDAYLKNYQWQVNHILKGIQQADTGQFATEEEVAQAFAKWRSKP